MKTSFSNLRQIFNFKQITFPLASLGENMKTRMMIDDYVDNCETKEKESGGDDDGENDYVALMMTIRATCLAHCLSGAAT